MSINDLFQSYIKFYGEFSGDTYNILRPNYSLVDNTPTPVYQNLVYRVDPSSAMFAEPKLRDVDWYEIFGDRDILQPGDILQKSTADGGQTPLVTFAHSMPIKAGVGFRSTRLCNITNQFDDVIYSNVYFDFMGVGFPGSSVNKKLEDSLRIPSTRIILFNRDNIFRLRTQIVEIDSPVMINKDGGDLTQFQRKWKVEEIDRTGNFCILTISSNLKD